MKVSYSSAVRFVTNRFSLILFLATILFACKKDRDDKLDQIKPSKPKPEWATDITPQMQTVIETLDSINPVPLITLTPAEARLKPTPADAVKIVMAKFGIATPAMKVDTSGIEIPTVNGSLHARVYKPKTNQGTYPVIVYYHGGGWVIATIDTYNASAQALAEQTNAIVVSVEYRKAPEFKFPAAHADAFNAYKWLVANAATFQGDSSKVALAGESAGGNMAVAVAIMARDSSVHKPSHILSVYPVASADMNSASYIQYANAKPLNKPLLEWFFMHYLNSATDAQSPLISLVDADLAGLPPTTIINAEIDPLLSDGESLESKLKAASVPVERKVYNGVTHEFFGMATVISQAADAQAYAARRLKNDLQ